MLDLGIEVPPRTTHAGQTLCTESADKPLANATNGNHHVNPELIDHENGDQNHNRNAGHQCVDGVNTGKDGHQSVGPPNTGHAVSRAMVVWA